MIDCVWYDVSITITFSIRLKKNRDELIDE
jgi:hypothetical protein